MVFLSALPTLARKPVALCPWKVLQEKWELVGGVNIFGSAVRLPSCCFPQRVLLFSCSVLPT